MTYMRFLYILCGIVVVVYGAFSCRHTYNKYVSLQDAYSLQIKGINYGKKGEYDKAIECFNRSIAINPEGVAIYKNRGLAYDKQKKYDLAKTDYDKAIKLDPEDAWAYNNRGIIYIRKRKYIEAIADFNKAILSDQKNPNAYANRATTLINMEKYEEAMIDAQKAIKLNHNHASAYYNLACAYALKQPVDEEEAVKHLRHAIELDKKHREQAKNEEDFTALRNNPSFQVLIETQE